MKITIIGTGYVGLVTGTCFAEMGNDVTCVDIDKLKIENLNNGKIPIYEPGLEELIIQNQMSGRLRFSSSLKDSISVSNIFMIAVGTPEGSDGSADLQYVYNVATDLGKNINSESIIIDKSTVPVGTAEQVSKIIKNELIKRNSKIKYHVVSNPEFLKEGDAINDFMRPDRVVIGSDSDYAINIIKQLYGPFTMNHDRLIIMGVKEAELTKYAANAMLATKISFINEIANICDSLNIDIESIRKGIGSDSRIGYSFIYPGVGYGGSCFPKDVKAIIQTARKSGVNPTVLEAVEARNSKQKNVMFNYIVEKFGDNLEGLLFSIWGLAFKPGTDDMREAPSIEIINSIILAGGRVNAFDPVANNEAQKQFPKKWIMDKKLIFADDNYSILDDSDAMILVTEWKMFRNPNINKMKKKMRKLCIFDGRNQYSPQVMKENGFYYKGIGR